MCSVAAPAATPSWMPEPSSPSAPTRTRQRRASGACASSMRSLWMKPPVVSTTPRRARSARARRTSPRPPAAHPPSVAHERAHAVVRRDARAARLDRRDQHAHEQGPVWCFICGT
jgi:hypothetical protein